MKFASVLALVAAASALKLRTRKPPSCAEVEAVFNAINTDATDAGVTKDELCAFQQEHVPDEDCNKWWADAPAEATADGHISLAEAEKFSKCTK